MSDSEANKNVELMRGEPEIAIKKLAIPIIISIIFGFQEKTVWFTFATLMSPIVPTQGPDKFRAFFVSL